MTRFFLVLAWGCCLVSAWCEMSSPPPKSLEQAFGSLARLVISMVLALGMVAAFFSLDTER